MILHCPSEIGSKDWERNLKCFRINYDGSEGGVAEGVTARQIEAAMPPDGLAGSVDILPLLYPGTREALLHPELVRKADEDIEWNWAMPKFFARSWGEDLKTKRPLYAKGFITAEGREFV